MNRYQELSIKEKREEKEEGTVYAVPKSADPGDYGLISKMDEKEILRRGLKGEIKVYSYDQVRSDVEENLKRFLTENFEEVYSKNKDRYKTFKYSLIGVPIFAFLFLFTGFFDDIVLNALAVGLFFFIHRLHKTEKSHIQGIKKRINRLQVENNPLLTEVFKSFQTLDADVPALPDMAAVREKMEPVEILKTLAAIVDYFKLNEIRKINRDLFSLNYFIQHNQGPKAWIARLVRRYRNYQLKAAEERLKTKTNLDEGYKEIYEYLLKETMENRGELREAEKKSFEASRIVRLLEGKED